MFLLAAFVALISAVNYFQQLHGPMSFLKALLLVSQFVAPYKCVCISWNPQNKRNGKKETNLIFLWYVLIATTRIHKITTKFTWESERHGFDEGIQHLGWIIFWHFFCGRRFSCRPWQVWTVWTSALTEMWNWPYKAAILFCPRSAPLFYKRRQTEITQKLAGKSLPESL